MKPLSRRPFLKFELQEQLLEEQLQVQAKRQDSIKIVSGWLRRRSCGGAFECAWTGENVNNVRGCGHLESSSSSIENLPRAFDKKVDFGCLVQTPCLA
jgi:hypothetical protein